MTKRMFFLVLVVMILAVACTATPQETVAPATASATAAPDQDGATALPEPDTPQPDATATATSPAASATAGALTAVPGTPDIATLAPVETATPQEDEVMTTPSGRPVNTDIPQVRVAVEDLAQRLSVAPDSIEVLEALAVIWPDSSMGCPQPGMAYTQVLTDGLFIRLQAEGKEYHYHSGGSRDPFLCTQGLESVPGGSVTPAPLDKTGGTDSADN